MRKSLAGMKMNNVKTLSRHENKETRKTLAATEIKTRTTQAATQKSKRENI